MPEVVIPLDGDLKCHRLHEGACCVVTGHVCMLLQPTAPYFLSFGTRFKIF